MTTETARSYYRRKGWNPGYGHKVKTLGRLVTVVVNGKELVDVEASDAKYAATVDPAKGHMAAVNEQQRAAHRGAAKPPAPPRTGAQFNDRQPGLGDASKNATYMQAKTAREVYEAKNSQLEYEERTSKLIRVDAVKTELSIAMATAREALLQIPSRLAPLLAAETDPAAVQTALHGEIHRALAQLAGASERLGQAVLEVE